MRWLLVVGTLSKHLESLSVCFASLWPGGHKGFCLQFVIHYRWHKELFGHMACLYNLLLLISTPACPKSLLAFENTFLFLDHPLPKHHVWELLSKFGFRKRGYLLSHIVQVTVVPWWLSCSEPICIVGCWWVYANCRLPLVLLVCILLTASTCKKGFCCILRLAW